MHAEAVLFDEVGTTQIGVIGATDIRWQDVLSERGSASFSIMDGATLENEVVYPRIVKFRLAGDDLPATDVTGAAANRFRFGVRLDPPLFTRAEPSRLDCTGQGLLSLLMDGCVFPAGFADNAETYTVEKRTLTGSRGAIIHTLVSEAQAIGCNGPSKLNLGFTATTDSAGVPWTGSVTVDLELFTLPLDDAVLALAENRLDVAVDPNTMTLHVYQDLGVDRSASVVLSGAPNTGNLAELTTQLVKPRATRAIVRRNNGRWKGVVEGDETYGRRYTGAYVGTSDDENTVAEVGAMLTGWAVCELRCKPATVRGSSPPVVGADAYLDYSLGDTITTPWHRFMSTMKAQVLEIVVDGSAEPAWTAPSVREVSVNM